MNVKQLIKELKKVPGDADVHLGCLHFDLKCPGRFAVHSISYDKQLDVVEFIAGEGLPNENE